MSDEAKRLDRTPHVQSNSEGPWSTRSSGGLGGRDRQTQRPIRIRASRCGTRSAPWAFHIEIHLSNIHAGKIPAPVAGAPVAAGQIARFGAESYRRACSRPRAYGAMTNASSNCAHGSRGGADAFFNLSTAKTGICRDSRVRRRRGDHAREALFVRLPVHGTGGGPGRGFDIARSGSPAPGARASGLPTNADGGVRSGVLSVAELHEIQAAFAGTLTTTPISFPRCAGSSRRKRLRRSGEPRPGRVPRSPGRMDTVPERELAAASSTSSASRRRGVV